MQTKTYSKLSDVQKLLVKKAEEAASNSYSPYSMFPVGAALLCEDGSIITGSNYENASYGATICAERVAISRANAEGMRSFRSMAIIAKGGKSSNPITPCGICRQILYEAGRYSNRDIEVIMSNEKKDRILVINISKLLPFAFSPKDIVIKRRSSLPHK
jgi:cytidine deaminase